MGWQGGHMHEFVIGETHYGQPEPGFQDDPPLVREDRVTLERSLGAATTLRYVYDFGDDWEHEITIDKVLPHDPVLKLPRCIAGANACPPEDVGGPPGYIEFLDAISNPGHDEHESMIEWIGGAFDPKAFDIAEVNERLAEFKL